MNEVLWKMACNWCNYQASKNRTADIYQPLLVVSFLRNAFSMPASRGSEPAGWMGMRQLFQWVWWCRRSAEDFLKTLCPSFKHTFFQVVVSLHGKTTGSPRDLRFYVPQSSSRVVSGTHGKTMKETPETPGYFYCFWMLLQSFKRLSPKKMSTENKKNSVFSHGGFVWFFDIFLSSLHEHTEILKQRCLHTFGLTTPSYTSGGDLVQEIKLPGHPFDDGAIFRSDSEDKQKMLREKR